MTGRSDEVEGEGKRENKENSRGKVTIIEKKKEVTNCKITIMIYYNLTLKKKTVCPNTKLCTISTLMVVLIYTLLR